MAVYLNAFWISPHNATGLSYIKKKKNPFFLVQKFKKHTKKKKKFLRGFGSEYVSVFKIFFLNSSSKNEFQ